MIFLAALALSFAAIYSLIVFIRAEKNTTSEVELPYGSLNELTDPDAFTQAYLSVNCNATLLENTQTIRVTGTDDKRRPQAGLFTDQKASRPDAVHNRPQFT